MTGPCACSSTPAPELTVRPKRDMLAEGLSVNEFAEDAVRATAKNILEVNKEVSIQNVESRILTEESKILPQVKTAPE